jgi:glycosyltransferase involved in cell wall biosynthesis
MGMGGTQRAAKFARYLPKFGWQPHIITVKNVQYYAQDATLLQELEHVPIYRTGSLDPLRLLAIWQNKGQSPKGGRQPAQTTTYQKKSLLKFLNALIGGWLFIPDSKILWLPFAFWRAQQIIRREKIKIIFTTSPPQSIHLLGRWLKLFCRVKWVADFRDEWTGGESQPCPTKFHAMVNRLMEKRVLRSADRVLGICQKLANNFQKKAGDAPQKCITLMNGFDKADFPADLSAGQNQKFTILHCGSLSKVSNPEPFLAGVAKLFDQKPELRSQIQIQFVGTDIFGQLPPLLEKYNLKHDVEVVNYLPHKEAITRMIQAHVLLLIVIKKGAEEIITGKVFEYLASGRRILAIIPEGELATIIRETAAGTIVSYKNINQIAATIDSYFEQFQNQQLLNTPAKAVYRYERENLTAALSNILNSLI